MALYEKVKYFTYLITVSQSAMTTTLTRHSQSAPCRHSACLQLINLVSQDIPFTGSRDDLYSPPIFFTNELTPLNNKALDLQSSQIQRSSDIYYNQKGLIKERLIRHR